MICSASRRHLAPGGCMTDRTRWFADCGWGVFCHWLGAAPSSDGGSELTAEAWNRRVDAFDVEGLAGQLESVGAPYFFVTIGQNSGHYIAPNQIYDEIVGIHPSKCSQPRPCLRSLRCSPPSRHRAPGVSAQWRAGGRPRCGVPAGMGVGVRRRVAGRLGQATHRQAAGVLPDQVGGGHTGLVDPLGLKGPRLVDRWLLLRR